MRKLDFCVSIEATLGWFLHKLLVLINETTQEVVELSQEASLLLAILQDVPSWSVALLMLRHQWEDEQEGEAEIDEQEVHAFVYGLQQDGWILINEHNGASHGI